jgi:fumarate reductase subunit D
MTPLLWLLFSAGGTVAAFLFPVHLSLTGLAFPLGWLGRPATRSSTGS